MAVHQNPLIAAMIAIGGMVLGVYLLRWGIPGLLQGKVRYRGAQYERFKRPIPFWFAIIWCLGTGIFFLLGGLLLFYIGVIKKFTFP